MQHKRTKRVYPIVLEFKNGVTRTVKTRAVTREIAEQRALKFHPNALGVKRDA